MTLWNEQDIADSVEDLIVLSSIDCVVEAIAAYCDNEAEYADEISGACYRKVGQALIDALRFFNTTE